MPSQIVARPESSLEKLPSKSAETTHQRIIWAYRALFAALFVFCFTVFAPCNPRLPLDELDNGWCLALHWAFSHSAQFGTQIVFTFGPWGFLWSGFSPATYPWMIGCWAFLSFSAWLGMLKVSQPLHWPILRISWMAIAIAFCNFHAGFIQDVRLYFICLLIVPLHFYVDARPLTAVKSLLIVAMALTALIKFSLLIFATGIIGILCADLILRKRPPWPAGIFTGAIFAFWLIAHQSLGNLLPYLANSWHMASAYSQAEAITIPGESHDLLLFAIIAGMLVATLIMAHRKGMIANGSMLWPALLFSLWMLLKFGFVRHDGHGEGITVLLTLLVLAFIAGAASRLRHPSIALLAGLTLFSGMRQAAASIGGNEIFSTLAAQLSEPFRMAPARLASVVNWTAHPKKLQEIFDQQLGQYAQTFPQLSGSVDCYPWGQTIVFADHLDYQPRPILQSYAAYTDHLQSLNAKILAGDQAPDHILLKIRGFDWTYPASQDGLSWPYFLTRYDITDVGEQNGWMVLSKSAHARNFSLSLINQTRAKLGQWIDLPASADPIWINADIHQTAFANFQQSLFKSPLLHLNVELNDGTQETYRLLPDVVRGGFLLSPKIDGAKSFVSLQSPQWQQLLPNQIVKRIQVECPDLAWFGQKAFHTDFTAIFSALEFEHPNIN